MTHRPELLSAMLDGEITEHEAHWVSVHLAECGRCKNELDDLSAARALVRSLPMLDLPDDLFPTERRVVPMWPRRLAVAAGSVAALAVVAFGALGLIGVAADGSASVGVREAEAILAATSSLAIGPDGSQVSEILASGSSASYSARQTLACRDGDGSLDSTADVTRIGSVTVLSDPLAELTVLARGSVSTGPAAGPIETVTVKGSVPPIGDYTVVASDNGEYRGRASQVVTLARDGVVRANLWIDEDTGVIVHRELLNADGTVACVLQLVEFDPIETPIQASIPFDITAEVATRVYEPVSGSMPDSLAGLGLAAVYPIAGGEVGVYGDGLFTVAVTRIDGGAVQSSDGDQQQVTGWESGGVSWAVIGSLPDDLMAELRAGLPQPDDPNPFVAGWRKLFG